MDKDRLDTVNVNDDVTESNEYPEANVGENIDKVFGYIECLDPTDEVPITLDQIIVKAPVKELAELLDYIKSPEKYKEHNYTPHTRIIIGGIKGSGKKVLIDAFAHEAGITLYRIDASHIIQCEDVDTLITTLFNDSDDRYALCIDSYDLLATQDDDTSFYKSISNIIAQQAILHPNVILFATSEQDIDFSDSTFNVFKDFICFPEPNLDERIEIIKTFVRQYKIEDDVDFNAIAKMYNGCNIGDIKALVEKAINNCNREGRYFHPTYDDFGNALDSLNEGEANTQHNEEATKLAAYHEAGHALLEYLLFGKDALLRVISLNRGGGTGGYTMGDYTKRSSFMTKKEWHNELILMYGGRAAEKLIYGEATCGCSGDIAQVEALIKQGLLSYGFSEQLPPVNMNSKLCGVSVVPPPAFVQDIVYHEMFEIVRKDESKADELIKSNRKKLEAIANYLIKNGSIESGKFYDIVKDVVEDSETSESGNNA